MQVALSLSGNRCCFTSEVDKNGNITSKVIMNYEEKLSHNFNLVYTKVIMFTLKQIVLNVQIILLMMVTILKMLILAHSKVLQDAISSSTLH